MPESTSLNSFLSLTDLAFKSLLYNKFGSILGLTNSVNEVVQYPPETALRHFSELEGYDHIEFISFWRDDAIVDRSRWNSSVAIDGIPVSYTDSNQTTITHVKAVPVKLSYRVYWWSEYRDRLNEIADLFMFWPFTNPNLSLYYNDSFQLEMDLLTGETLSDESSYTSEFNKGRLLGVSGTVNIDGWTLMSDGGDTGIIETIYLKMYDNLIGKTVTEVKADYDSDGSYQGDLTQITNIVIS